MYASADNTLPPAVVHTLQAAGIDLGQNDHITLADLNASFEAAGIAPADRIVAKQELVRLSKVIA